MGVGLALSALILCAGWGQAHEELPSLPPLDAGFAGSGLMFLPPERGLLPVQLALQADGHMLLLAAEQRGGGRRLALLRFQPDGAPDLDFAARGVWHSAPWPGLPNDSQFMIRATMTVAPDGRMLIGQGDEGATALYRLSADGQPDASFGTGGQTGLGFSVQTILASPDGSLILVGEQPNLANDRRPVWALARLRADGRKDSTFQGGFVRPFGLLEGDVGAATLLPDGTFLVAGDQHDAARHRTRPLVVRFRANGQVDAGFGLNGQATLTSEPPCSFRAMTLDSAGRVLTAGWCGVRQHVVARFTPSGTPDPTFGQGGIQPGVDALNQITTLPGGLITVAGIQVGGEELTSAFLEQKPDERQFQPTNPSPRRLALSTAMWPVALPSGTQFTRITSLLTDLQGRLLVLAQTHVESETGGANSGALLRFTAPFKLD